jgi:hypothetical protein
MTVVRCLAVSFMKSLLEWYYFYLQCPSTRTFQYQYIGGTTRYTRLVFIETTTHKEYKIHQVEMNFACIRLLQSGKQSLHLTAIISVGKPRLFPVWTQPSFTLIGLLTCKNCKRPSLIPSTNSPNVSAAQHIWFSKLPTAWDNNLAWHTI